MLISVRLPETVYWHPGCIRLKLPPSGDLIDKSIKKEISFHFADCDRRLFPAADAWCFSAQVQTLVTAEVLIQLVSSSKVIEYRISGICPSCSWTHHKDSWLLRTDACWVGKASLIIQNSPQMHQTKVTSLFLRREEEKVETFGLCNFLPWWRVFGFWTKRRKSADVTSRKLWWAFVTNIWYFID